MSIKSELLQIRVSEHFLKQLKIDLFVRMLTVHCDQKNNYEITINGFQVRKINEIRNIILGLSYGKPSSAFLEVGMFTKLSTWLFVWLDNHLQLFHNYYFDYKHYLLYGLCRFDQRLSFSQMSVMQDLLSMEFIIMIIRTCLFSYYFSNLKLWIMKFIKIFLCKREKY